MALELFKTISVGSCFHLQMDLRWSGCIRTSAGGQDQISDFCHIYLGSL